MRAYAAFRDAEGISPEKRVIGPGSGKALSTTSLLTETSIPGLMRLYAATLAELRMRGVLRSANGPIGDYAEHLFASAFGWTLVGNSTAHHDAINDAGIRYQIKSRRLSTASTSRQLGAIRRLDDHGFDVLAALLFDADVAVHRAVLILYAQVVSLARRVDHTNSWRVMLSDIVCALPTVTDVTAEVRRAAGATG